MIVVRVEIAMILLLLMVIMMKFMMMAKMVLISKMMMAMVTSAPCRCTGRRCRWTLLQSRSSALSVSPARVKMSMNLKGYENKNQNVKELKRIWIRDENVWWGQNGDLLTMRIWMVNNTYMVRKGHKEFSGNEIRNCIFLYFSLLTRDSPTPVWHLSSLTPEKSTLWTPSKMLTL